MDEAEKKQKKVKPATIAIAIAVLAVFFIGLNCVFIYGLGEYNRINAFSSRIIPFPAAMVGSKNISYRELKSNLGAIKKFYQSQDFSEVGLRIDFSTTDGQKRLMIREKDLLNKMIEDAAIERLARQHGKTVSEDAINQSVSRALEEYQNEQTVAENLERLYGWNITEFKEKIIRPQLFKEELHKVYQADEAVKKANAAKADSIRKASEELADKVDFAEVAQKYSEGGNAKNGGDLGWFGEDQLIAPVGAEVAKLENGKMTDIIESELGYHIVELLEKKEESGKKIYHIRQIFVAKHDFASWLTEKMKAIRIRIYSKNYYWDKGDLAVKFRDSQLAEFEQKVLEQFQGDPSVIY